MAVIDVAGYVAELKEHSVDHGFHVHDERHFVETYSLRQAWEVDLHPEEGCGGPLDLHLALEVDPRSCSRLRTPWSGCPRTTSRPSFHFPLTFTWALPPLPHGPDLLRLAIDLAGVGGIELPLEVSAIDSFASATDPAERRLNMVARSTVSLARILAGEELICEIFDRVWRSAGTSSTHRVAGWGEVRHDPGPIPASGRRDHGGYRARRATLSACGNSGTSLAQQA